MARRARLHGQARVKRNGLIAALDGDNEELIVARARNLLPYGPAEGNQKESWLCNELGTDNAKRVLELLHAAQSRASDGDGEEPPEEVTNQEPQWEGRRHDPCRRRRRRATLI